jgi:hypothetical protein
MKSRRRIAFLKARTTPITMRLQQVVQQALHISALVCPTGAKALPESKTEFLRLSNRPVKAGLAIRVKTNGARLGVRAPLCVAAKFRRCQTSANYSQ